jgi:hypothetical protein
VFIDRGVRVVVAPVEPIIFQGGDAGKAFSLRRAGGGAALEVPLAGGGGVEQHPRFFCFRSFLRLSIGWHVGLQKEFGVAAVDAGEEDAEGFAVGAKDEKQGRAVDAVENGRLLGESFPGIGASGAVEGESDDHIARLEFGAGKAEDDGELGDIRFPVGVVFFGVFGDGREHLPGGRLGAPLAEGEFVAEHEFERCALQRAVDGFAGDLLPPGSGFAVAHEEVLVVDAGEIKVQYSPVDSSRPHQTGVTERSIGDGDRYAANHIIEDVMVRHLADGIGVGVGAEADGHDHFFGVELALGLREELRTGDGMEHPFEVIEAGHDGRECDDKEHQREESLAPEAHGFPQGESEDEASEGRDERAQRGVLAEGHRHQ